MGAAMVDRATRDATTMLWSPGGDRGPIDPRLIFHGTEYELIEPIGRGGMGTVFRGAHRKLNRPVAIKLLADRRREDPHAVARFLREMQVIGQLDHPHLVRAYDAGDRGGTHFLVMEFVEGLDAHRLVKATGKLSIADACEIARQAASGLAHIQRLGLVHRDIKPSNLLISLEGVVKVADLGLARLESWRDPKDLLTNAGDAVGTVDFMAPEQASVSTDVTIQADIYGLGCTLYFLLTGRVVFPDPPFNTQVKKVMAHVRETPAPLAELRPDVPEALAAVVTRMLAKAPAERYAQPTEVAAELAPFAKESDLSALVRRFVGELPSRDDSRFGRDHSSAASASDTHPANFSSTPVHLSPGSAGAATVGGKWRIFAALASASVVITGLAWFEPWRSREDALESMAASTGEPSRSQSTVEKEWRDALEGPPTPLVFPGQRGSASWRFSDASGALELTSEYRRLIKLGEVKRLPHRVEIDIYRPVWEGGVGVFFGYRQDAGSGLEVARFHIVQLLRIVEPKRTAFEIERMKTAIHPKSHSMAPDGIAFRQPVAWPLTGQPQRLVVEIDAAGFSRISWGGQQLSELTTRNANAAVKPNDLLGPWGLYQLSSTSWFSRPRVAVTTMEDD